MNLWFLVLAFGVPFLITAILYAFALRNYGNKPWLTVIACVYVTLNIIGPVSASAGYLIKTQSFDQFWFAVAAVLASRGVELIVLDLGPGFAHAWRHPQKSARKNH